METGAARSAGDETAELPIRYGAALLQSGMPVYSAERAMLELAGRLGIPLQVTTEPFRIIAVTRPPASPEAWVVKVTAGAPNVGRYARLAAVGDALVAGGVDPREARRRLDAAAAPAAPAHPLIPALLFALMSLAISVLLGGGWAEMLAAGVGGLTAGLTIAVTGRLSLEPVLQQLFAAATATLAGIGIAHVIGPYSTLIAVAAALIALLPGFALFLGTIEIVRGYPAAGLQRIASAMLTLLALSGGVAVGAAFISLAPALRQVVQPVPAPEWTMIGAYACFSLAIYLQLDGRREDIGWIAASCLAGIVGVTLGRHLPNNELTTFLAALLVGAVGQVGARKVGLPSIVLMVPGTMILLPGSLAFRGVLQLLGPNVQVGVEFLVQALLTLVLITVGLITAEVLVRPHPSART